MKNVFLYKNFILIRYDIGIMREEPQIKVPKKLLQELIAVRDPEKPISEKLQKLIRQMMVVKKALSRK